MELDVEIKNVAPVELTDLTIAFNALARQFNKYSEGNGYPIENRDAKLYVKKLETGSIIGSFMEGTANFAQSVMPMMDDTNNIVGFVSFLKGIFSYFKEGKGEKPALKESDYNDFSAIINPTASDVGAQLNISAKDQAQVYVSLNVPSLDANALQNVFKKEIDNLKASKAGSEYEKVLFYWKQTTIGSSVKSGNKGVVESILQAAIPVFIEDDDIRSKMTDVELNPYHMIFIVDLTIEEVQGKIALYRITKLHEAYLRDDEQDQQRHNPTHPAA